MSLIEKVTDEALALTEMWVADIRSQMEGGIADMTMRQKQELTGLLAKLMRAATGMIKEARSLAKDAATLARQMTYEEKRRLVREFIEMMPPEHREDLRQELGW